MRALLWRAGRLGVAYTRIFKPSLIGGLWAETDESGCTLAEHLLQTDEGSPGNPFHGNAQQVAKATRLRLVRSKKCYCPFGLRTRDF